MQAILVIGIVDYGRIAKMLGPKEEADMIYRYRDIVTLRLKDRVFDRCREYIYATSSSVREAITLAKKVIGDLCPRDGSDCIPVSVSIGYGDLYETVDGNYWGSEIKNASDLLIGNNISSGNIFLTNMAKRQLPNIGGTKCM